MKRRRRAATGLQPGAAGEETQKLTPQNSAVAVAPQSGCGWHALIAAATTAGWTMGLTPRGGVVFSRAGTVVYGPTATANPEAIAEVRERLRWADRLVTRWGRS